MVFVGAGAKVSISSSVRMIVIAAALAILCSPALGIPSPFVRILKDGDSGGSDYTPGGSGYDATQRLEVTGIKDPPRYSEVVARGIASGQANRGSGHRQGGGGRATNTPGTKDPAPENTQTAPSDCGSGGGGGDNPTTGSPVIIATGEKNKSEFDIPAGSAYGLGLTRTYRSFNVNAIMFGQRWLSEYDYPTLARSGCVQLSDYGNLCIPQSVAVTFPDGSSYQYTRTSQLGGLLYLPLNGSTAVGRLVYSPYDNWTLTVIKTTYRYSPAGNIQSVSASGNSLQFAYGANPRQPTSVTNASGQNLQFT
jgi:hypothetical protein